MKDLTICILGDRDPAMATHRALDTARNDALVGLSLAVNFEWTGTADLDLNNLGARFRALWVAPGSQLSGLLGAEALVGRYFFSYGLEPAYGPLLEEHGLRWTSWNQAKVPRSFELAGHPLYWGCLFQPPLT